MTMLAGAKLIASLSRFGPLTRAAAGDFAKLLSARSFKRGEWLLRAGDRASMSHYIAGGLVRELYTDAGGAEHTRSFLAEGGITGSLVDLISGRPAITWIEALEPVETLSFSHNEFVKLCHRHPCLERILRRFLEDLLVRKIRREHDLLALPASQRYSAWVRDFGHLDERVRRRDLASYLGISPEYLSRLSARRRGATPARNVSS